MGRGGSRGRSALPGARAPSRAPGAQGQGRKGSDGRRAQHHVGARRGRGGGHSAPTCRAHPAPLKGKGKVTPQGGGAGERAGRITQASLHRVWSRNRWKRGVGTIKTERERGDASPAREPQGPRAHAFARKAPRRAWLASGKPGARDPRTLTCAQRAGPGGAGSPRPHLIETFSWCVLGPRVPSPRNPPPRWEWGARSPRREPVASRGAPLPAALPHIGRLAGRPRDSL